MTNNQQVFFALVRAGLWEQEARLLPCGKIDFEEVLQLATEQAVVGLVAEGMEHVTDVIIPKNVALNFAGAVLQLEQRNKAMNLFIAELTERFRCAPFVLIKGQGVAQCYIKPLWRVCGDIDCLLNSERFEKGKEILNSEKIVSEERGFDKHVGYQIGHWEVELHGALSCGLSTKMERALNELYDDIVNRGRVRSWVNQGKTILLPDANCDVFVLFTHIVKHFYKGGVGIRQLCDLSRLLWTFRSSIDQDYVGSRLRAMGLVTEWKAFGAYMHEYLGLPINAIPLYEDSNKWRKKADKIQEYILLVGNFGHNRKEFNFNLRSVNVAMGWIRRIKDFIHHGKIFPIDTACFFWYIFSGKFVGRFD